MRSRQRSPAAKVAQAQGLFNVVGGAWPIISLRSFEWIYGKKNDIFLQRTVGGLLLSIGYAQLSASDSEQGLRVARRFGLATALTLLANDLVYIPKGEMRNTYLQALACDIGWIVARSRAQ